MLRRSLIDQLPRTLEEEIIEIHESRRRDVEDHAIDKHSNSIISALSEDSEVVATDQLGNAIRNTTVSHALESVTQIMSPKRHGPTKLVFLGVLVLACSAFFLKFSKSRKKKKRYGGGSGLSTHNSGMPNQELTEAVSEDGSSVQSSIMTENTDSGFKCDPPKSPVGNRIDDL